VYTGGLQAEVFLSSLQFLFQKYEHAQKVSDFRYAAVSTECTSDHLA
jgi:hypothetical protein